FWPPSRPAATPEKKAGTRARAAPVTPPLRNGGTRTAASARWEERIANPPGKKARPGGIGITLRPAKARRPIPGGTATSPPGRKRTRSKNRRTEKPERRRKPGARRGNPRR